eukprot:TRINITY_DN807_c0_g1_i3.p1 TRINITY_DN807_c0_g1~~TRINITY_DN807_c0_g1_i3.p1  ORF type:complete len:684 (+),score=168.82 TRINITY_DN807_c0_g1_i3:302-2053(+)
MAQKKEIPGSLKYVLETVNTLIFHMKPFLLGHSSIYKALHALFQVSQPEKEQLLKLIETLIAKFRAYPFLTRLFMIEPSQVENMDQHHSCSLFRTLSEIYPHNNSPFKREVKRVLLSLVKSVSDPTVQTLKGEEMTKKLVEEVVEAFSELPFIIETLPVHMGEFFPTLDYVCSLTTSTQFESFQLSIKESIEKDLLHDVIGPRLYEGNKKVVSATVSYLREIFLHLGSSSPLAETFVGFLFKETDFDKKPLIQHLTDLFVLPTVVTVESPTEEQVPLALTKEDNAMLGTNTLRLFSLVLSWIEIDLVSKFLSEIAEPYIGILPSESGKQDSLDMYGKLARLTLEQALETSEYKLALESFSSVRHKVKRLKADSKKILDLPVNTPTKTPLKKSHTKSTTTQTNKKDSANSTTTTTTTTTSTSTSTTNEDIEKQKFVESASKFITSLYKAFDNFYMNIFEYNLALTEVFTKICLFPSKTVQKFLLVTSLDNADEEYKDAPCFFVLFKKLNEKVLKLDEKSLSDARIRIQEYTPFHMPERLEEDNIAIFAEFKVEAYTTLLASQQSQIQYAQKKKEKKRKKMEHLY